jgi:hypothetical protein
MSRPLVEVGDVLDLEPGEWVAGEIGNFFVPLAPARVTVLNLEKGAPTWECDWVTMTGERDGIEICLAVRVRCLPGYVAPVSMW